MTKIKDLFANIVANYKENLKEYTLTHIAILLTSILLIFWNYKTAKDLSISILIIGVIAIINLFTTETYFKDKTKKICFGIMSIIIAIAFERAIKLMDNATIRRITIGYSIVVFLLGWFKAIKNSGIEFHKYIIKFLQNLVKTGVIYLILNAGLTIILVVFCALILNGYSYWLIMRLQIALVGLFLAPAAILSITNMKEDISKFTKVIILYVLTPLTILMTFIIYLYMAKIFFIHEIPSNSIYRILTGLFIVAFPVWTMDYEFKSQNRLAEQFCKIMPIAFILFIFLQMYSLGTRCISNGITPVRYIGIMFIIFEIATEFLTLFKQRKFMIHTVTIFAVIITISTIIPVVNMETISNINQASRLKRVWKEGQDFESLSTEQKRIAKGAYNYLKDQDSGEKYIPSYITESDFTNSNNTKYNMNYESVSYSLDDNKNIDVTAYSKIKQISSSDYYSGYSSDSLKSFRLNSSITVNLADYVAEVIKQNEENESKAEEYIANNSVIKIDDQRDFYIKSFSLSYTYDGISTSIKGLYVSGFVMIK